MSTALDETYLTVAEAATRLRVNQSTIRRWIASGRLPAFRLGRRRLALKESDVAAMFAPVHDLGGGMREAHILYTPDGRPYLPPLTPEERQRIREFLESTERWHAEQLERRGGVPFSPSWELLNEARDERTEQLP